MTSWTAALPWPIMLDQELLQRHWKIRHVATRLWSISMWLEIPADMALLNPRNKVLNTMTRRSAAPRPGKSNKSISSHPGIDVRESPALLVMSPRSSMWSTAPKFHPDRSC